MLRCVLTDIRGKELIFPSPLSVAVNIDEGAPADSLYAVFPLIKTEELKSIAVYSSDKLVFTGLVDEEEYMLNAAGEYLCISARSLAAHLLDNEAVPCSYDHPSAQLIYERYVKPYGIVMSDSDDSTYFGEQTVTKGTSCWNVLKRFCMACYSSVPRISSDGVLYMKGMRKDNGISFGETSAAIRYTGFSRIKKRCEEISAVYVKTSNAGGYELSVENADAVGRGIVRRRYLNAVLTASPMRCADAMISNGTAKSYAVELRCPGCCLGMEGSRASVVNSVVGDIEGLYVSALCYRLTSKDEYTDVILKRRTD